MLFTLLINSVSLYKWLLAICIVSSLIGLKEITFILQLTLGNLNRRKHVHIREYAFWLFLDHPIYIYVCIYIVVKTREFSENKVHNIVYIELWQLWLHLHPHVVNMCFTYADDDYIYICMYISIYLSEDHRRHWRMWNAVSQRAEVSVNLTICIYIYIYAKLRKTWIMIYEIPCNGLQKINKTSKPKLKIQWNAHIV